MPQNYRLAPDFENAGVGIAIKNNWLGAVKDVGQLNGRVMYITFCTKGPDITLVCAYAPQSGLDPEVKETLCQDLNSVVNSAKGNVTIGGDFNARIYHKREVDSDVVGNHITEKSAEALTQLSDKTRENRDLFLGFCKSHCFVAANTWFDKPKNKLVTYMEKCQENSKDSERYAGPPYDHTRYAQIDYWLVNEAQKGVVIDVQSRIDLPASDHFLLEIILEIPMGCTKKKKGYKCKRFLKPGAESWNNYNRHVKEHVGHNGLTLGSFTTAVLQAANEQLEEEPFEKKKDYISKQTWDKIEERNRLFKKDTRNEEVKKINREIAKDAKVDKRQHTIEQFNENPLDKNEKSLWKAVKGLKKKFQPKYVQMKSQDGKHVPLTKRAETIAQYLEQEHWKNDADMGIGNPDFSKIFDDHFADERPFSMDELKVALKASKLN